MSDMEHVKVKLQPVKLFEDNLQGYIEMKYSLYLSDEVDNLVAYQVLEDFYEKEDLEFPYYLFDDVLYKVVEERELDPYGYVEANFLDSDTIEVDSFWYNGGGSLRECINKGLKQLEEKM